MNKIIASSPGGGCVGFGSVHVRAQLSPRRSRSGSLLPFSGPERVFRPLDAAGLQTFMRTARRHRERQEGRVHLPRFRRRRIRASCALMRRS